MQRSKTLPIIISTFCFVLCCYLGVWQLQRLEYKNNKLSSITASIEAKAKTVSDLSVQGLKYTKTSLNGHFTDATTNLFTFARQKVTNTEHGYIVLTPFILDNGDSILVSRGLVADSKRPQITNDTGEQTISGLLMDSEIAKRFDPENVPDKSVWFTINLKEIGEATNHDFGEYYLMQLGGEGSEYLTPFDPAKLVTIYNPHLGYAITWFGIAIAIAVIFITSTYPGLLCRIFCKKAK